MQRRPVRLAALLLAAAGTLAAAAPSTSYRARAARLLRHAIVVDSHEDVPERLEKEWVDIGVRNRTGHVDIPRLKEGGVTAPFFAAYIPASYAKSGGAAKKALELIEVIHGLVDAHPELTFAASPAEIRAAKRRGRIAVLIGIEGGHAIEDSLGALHSFHRLGVRYMTLTHTNTNNWADSSGNFFSSGFDPKKYAVHGGLTEFGREVVLEMNRLGMLVDVSHVSDATLEDVLEVSRAPVFASHSSCRAISPLPRNLTDDQIRAIGKKGGVVMVNFSSTFVDPKVFEAYRAAKAALEPKVAEINARYKDDPKKRDEETDKLFDALKPPRAQWSMVVDHIDRVIKLGGREAVGLGTDYDGISDPPEGLEDVSKLPLVVEELLRRGHSERVVRGVLGENFLKFWDRVEKARAGMPPRTERLPFSKPGA